MRDALAVGIDLGGTATRFVALDEADATRAQVIVATPPTGNPESLVQFLAGNIRAVAGGAAPSSIGIGASGPIDAEGVIRNPDSLPAFTGVDLLGGLERAFGLRAFIDNDAVTAAIGEHRTGAGRGSDDLLVVTLGTGVGVALLQHGAPFRTAGGEHPEASHLSVDGPPAPCYCGRSSCWEQLASRTALQNASSRLFDDPQGTSADIDRAVILAGRREDAALAVFDGFGASLAAGLANLASAYQPDRIVLGGSGARYLPQFEAAMNAVLAGIPTAASIEVRVCELREVGGAIGAALAGRDA